MSAIIAPNDRVIHRTHPEYGFGLVRYVEEDAFGDQRLQVAFDHLDNLENVVPAEVEIVETPYEENQLILRELDMQRRKEDPEFQGAFHEKKPYEVKMKEKEKRRSKRR